MDFCLTVDDVAYDGYSTEPHLDNLLQFAEEQRVCLTLFVVPMSQGRPLAEQPGYVRRLRDAIARGHEVAQHGLEHDRFETGFPPDMILSLPHEGPARARIAAEKDRLVENLSVDRIRQRLRLGRTILTEALGREPRGFRAPALSTCDNLFVALESEGYAWDSSCVLQETAWDLINGRTGAPPRPIDRQRVESLQRFAHLRTIPASAEYTWYPTRQRFAEFFALATHDLESCFRAGIPFVPLCHVSPVQEGDAGCGLEFYRELLAQARQWTKEHGQPLRCGTLSEAAA